MNVAILTGGGDCPGLNAVLRAFVKTAQNVYGWEVIGVRNGFEGFLEPAGRGFVTLTRESIRGILPRGGTILGASNRCDIFAIPRRSGPPSDESGRVKRALRRLKARALVLVGGEGTQKAALRLHRLGVPVVGVPKTIDNDLGGTDRTFGFDTATHVVMAALDRLHTTAESHHRVMCVEVMGRHAGWIALHGGLAGGADVILIPEIPFDARRIAQKVASRVGFGRTFSLVVVAEGAHPADGAQVWAQGVGRDPIRDRLGGVGEQVAREVSRLTGLETRTTVLGHVQRGGTPTVYDRVLATRMGSHAAALVAEKAFGRMVALKGTEMASVSLAEAVRRLKRVDPTCCTVAQARAIGISFAAADGSDDASARRRSKHGMP